MRRDSQAFIFNRTVVVNGYDLRLIVFTDDNGNRLLNADNWTSLHDIPGGSQINPFRAYAKFEDDRVFEAFGSHTETLQLYFPAGITSLDFAIDASYPGNCEEPYEIKVVRIGDLTPEIGNQTILEVDVYDWQEDLTNVHLHCPSITGFPLVSFRHLSERRWSLNIENYTGAGSGAYTGYLVASSLNSGLISLYKEIKIEVKENKGWARSWGGTGEDAGWVVNTNYSGAIYVTGYYEGTVDFNPGIPENKHTSNGGRDIYLSRFDSSGNYLWSRTWGGSGGDYAKGLSVDNSGNVYVSGHFSGNVDFDPGPGADQHSSNGGNDIYISKFDPNGHFLWALTCGGTSSEDIESSEVDAYGNIYISGYFTGNTDFDPGPEVFQIMTNGLKDDYLAKYNSAGDFIWAVSWGGSEQDNSYDLAVDEIGSAYVTGDFSATVDFDPGSGIDERTAMGLSDGYLIRFDPDGNLNWVETWEGSEWSAGFGVTLDGYDSVYVAGSFTETVDFDPGPLVNEYTSNGSNDVFLCKYDIDDQFIWVRVWGGIDFDRAAGIFTNNLGNVYIASRFGAVVDFDPGPGVDEHTARGTQDIYLTVFDPDGEHLWVRTWGGDGKDGGMEVVVDNTDKIYLTGTFADVVDFDLSSDIDEHTANGERDIFLMKLMSEGYYE